MTIKSWTDEEVIKEAAGESAHFRAIAREVLRLRNGLRYINNMWEANKGRPGLAEDMTACACRILNGGVP
jgi:hypothetical protein